MAVSRVTVPQEFYDITSSLLLKQPTPEFFFAKLALAAQARAAISNTDAASVLTGPRGVSSQGAAVMGLDEHQLSLATDPLAMAITGVEDASKAGVGETIRFNRPVFAGGNYTTAGRTINQASTISLTPIEIGMEQTSLTVLKQSGPRSSAGSEVQPFAIDRLASQRSVHSLVQLVGLNLVYDRCATLDGVFKALFDLGSLVQRPAGISADANFPTTGEVPLDLDTLLRAEEQLRTANIPRFSDGTYFAIVSPKQMRQLRTDPDFAKQSVFSPGMNPILNSSVTLVGQSIRVVECSTVPTDTSTVTPNVIQRGMMFGPGAVGFGVADPCRIVAANEDNYGETVKVIWMAYEASGMLDSGMICSLRSV